MVVLVHKIRGRAVSRTLTLGRPLVPACEKHDLRVEIQGLVELFFEIYSLSGVSDPGLGVGNDIITSADVGSRVSGGHHGDKLVLAVVLSGLLGIPTAPWPFVLTVAEPGIGTCVVPEEPRMP